MSTEQYEWTSIRTLASHHPHTSPQRIPAPSSLDFAIFRKRIPRILALCPPAVRAPSSPSVPGACTDSPPSWHWFRDPPQHASALLLGPRLQGCPWDAIAPTTRPLLGAWPVVCAKTPYPTNHVEPSGVSRDAHEGCESCGPCIGTEAEVRQRRAEVEEIRVRHLPH